MQRTIMMLWVLAGALGCSDESKITRSAETLCEYGQLEVLQPDALPETVDLTNLVRLEDLQFAKSLDSTTGSFGGMGVAWKPVLRAVTEATAKHTSCTVAEPVIVADSANVEVTRVAPVVGHGLPLATMIERLSEIQELATHDDRVAKVGEWIEKGGEPKKTTHDIHFVKAGDSWVANYRLPEEAKDAEAKAERAAQASELRLKALQLLNDSQYRESLATAREAKALEPDNADVDELVQECQSEVDKLIAGNWRFTTETDPMTDEAEAYAILYAAEKVAAVIGTTRPSLILRCDDGLSAYVNVTGAVVDGDWNSRVRGSARFGDAKQERITLSRASSGDAVFFRDAASWMDKFATNHDKPFLLQIPVFQGADIIAKFQLNGVDLAVEKIRAVCSKSE